MQQSTTGINIKFILVTEEISFIPDNIITCCKIINVQRPTKLLYNKCIKNKLSPLIQLENIINIKHLNCSNNDVVIPHKIICEKIIKVMLNPDDLDFLKFRDLQYDAFIVSLDITECLWYIFSSLLKQNKIHHKDVSKILIKIYSFLQYYNNNYRPIYHFEKILLYLTAIIHNYDV